MDRIEGFEAQWNKEEEPDMLLMQSAAIVSDMADLLQEGFAGRDAAPLQANGK